MRLKSGESWFSFFFFWMSHRKRCQKYFNFYFVTLRGVAATWAALINSSILGVVFCLQSPWSLPYPTQILLHIIWYPSLLCLWHHKVSFHWVQVPIYGDLTILITISSSMNTSQVFPQLFSILMKIRIEYMLTPNF